MQPCTRGLSSTSERRTSAATRFSREQDTADKINWLAEAGTSWLSAAARPSSYTAKAAPKAISIFTAAGFESAAWAAVHNTSSGQAYSTRLNARQLFPANSCLKSPLCCFDTCMLCIFCEVCYAFFLKQTMPVCQSVSPEQIQC